MPQKPEFAAACFHRAAESGYVGGQRSLAGCYEIGLGVEKSLLKAIFCNRAADEGSDPESQMILASIYEHGDETQLLPPDPSKAREYYIKAAEQGVKEATVVLEDELNQEEKRNAQAKCALERMLRRGLTRGFVSWLAIHRMRPYMTELEAKMAVSLMRMQQYVTARSVNTWRVVAIERDRALTVVSRGVAHMKGASLNWAYKAWQEESNLFLTKREAGTRAFLHMARRQLHTAWDTWRHQATSSESQP